MSIEDVYRNAYDALRSIQAKVNEQADDNEIWEVPAGRRRTLHEELLLDELRVLHDTIEQFTIPLFERITMLN